MLREELVIKGGFGVTDHDVFLLKLHGMINKSKTTNAVPLLQKSKVGKMRNSFNG